ncbi:universal stress protein [Rufibacter psychrotolerans]|uniref:universal stress protein n=1 Tax=Rufibacter psychrotolerans TaxID=2812556 RepID=UPI0019683F71|nr:universal stress protein [Rufibacter sp. SYSU D00308]
MKTILVPTDFSSIATNALAYAVALASVTRAKILLVHVVDLPAIATAYEVSLPAISLQVLADAEKELETLAATVRTNATLEVEGICTTGKLVAQVNHLVQVHGVDFVVMGSHGQSGLLDRIFGTNALAYMNHAHCPVLLVPPTATFKGINHIAFAYDLDSESTFVLERLFQWAAPFQAQVAIFNCLSEHQLNLVPDQPLLQYITQHFAQENFCLVQRKEDHVVQGILDFAQENQMDVVAISTHERIFLEQLLHTSVTKELLFKTNLPLLAIQEKPYSETLKQRSAALLLEVV